MMGRAIFFEENAPEGTDEENADEAADDLDGPWSIKPFDPEGREFKLTDAERAVYEEYVRTLDINLFKDLPPVSIVKIHIQCGIDGEWEAEYTMFSEKGLFLTKEEYHGEHIKDLSSADFSSRKTLADMIFSTIENGVFVDSDDGLGHYDFVTDVNEPVEFYLVKNSDGIWLPKIEPFSAWD